MAIKKSDIYRSLWESCDQLRDGMDASLYKDYILTLLFVKYVSDRAGQPDALIEVPTGASFSDMKALRGSKNIGEGMDTIIARIAEERNVCWRMNGRLCARQDGTIWRARYAGCRRRMAMARATTSRVSPRTGSRG